MGDVVDLATWRRIPPVDGDEGSDPDIRRLELAVSKLDAAASARLDRSGRLGPSVETELLAILGALASDLVEEAAARSERLAARLSGLAGSL